MKKRCVILMLSIGILFTLNGCGNSPETVKIQLKSDGTKKETVEIGTGSLKKIGAGLYYDKHTHIVYWWNGYLGASDNDVYYQDTTPTPYYSSNGLPYKYNPDTNTLEEVLMYGW